MARHGEGWASVYRTTIVHHPTSLPARFVSAENKYLLAEDVAAARYSDLQSKGEGRKTALCFCRCCRSFFSSAFFSTPISHSFYLTRTYLDWSDPSDDPPLEENVFEAGGRAEGVEGRNKDECPSSHCGVSSGTWTEIALAGVGEGSRRSFFPLLFFFSLFHCTWLSRQSSSACFCVSVSKLVGVSCLTVGLWIPQLLGFWFSMEYSSCW